ncbi:MAG TPA: hypothetical protein VMT85_01490 [Thermoanaerobaculia bacterium]|nr:hypothetical protein [Thermoanaerobaculia bacterium]
MADALRAERAAPEPSYRLRVDCDGERGVRRLEVFRSGAAIWELHTHVMLPVQTRVDLLHRLDEGGFVALEPRYGGKPEATKEPARALRIVCRIELELDGVRASSIQFADGEQSKALRSLANALLDAVAPLAASGTRVDGLEQGLELLSRGDLLPEGFELRFVELPRPGTTTVPGTILRVEHRTATTRVYLPGVELGEPVSTELSDDAFRSLIGELVAANLQSLPVNLWAEDQLDLEVRVLGHQRSIQARPFSRLGSDTLGEAQRRFDRLVEAIRALVPGPQ